MSPMKWPSLVSSLITSEDAALDPSSLSPTDLLTSPSPVSRGIWRLAHHLSINTDTILGDFEALVGHIFTILALIPQLSQDY